MNKLVPSQTELNKWLKNLALFTAPALVIFFYQLSQGIPFKEALPLAMFALYGLIADYFRKLNK